MLTSSPSCILSNFFFNQIPLILRPLFQSPQLTESLRQATLDVASTSAFQLQASLNNKNQSFRFCDKLSQNFAAHCRKKPIHNFSLTKEILFHPYFNKLQT